MTQHERLTKHAERFNATVDWPEDSDGFTVDSPTGYIWQSNGCHMIVEQFANVSGQTWVREAVTEAISRMGKDRKDGLCPCDRGPNCDICEENIEAFQEHRT